MGSSHQNWHPKLGQKSVDNLQLPMLQENLTVDFCCIFLPRNSKPPIDHAWSMIWFGLKPSFLMANCIIASIEIRISALENNFFIVPLFTD
jgi:hypothetical protein